VRQRDVNNGAGVACAKIIAMKSLLVVICVLFFSCIGYSQRMTDRDLEGFRGNVKVVESWSEQQGPDGKPVKKPEVMNIEAYDIEGNRVSETSYWTGEKNTYFVLDGDRVAKTERITNDPRVKIQMLGTIETGGQKKPKDKRFDERYKYEYDKSGRITELKQYFSDGKLWLTKKFTYDTAGRIILEKGTIEDRPRYQESLTYDSNGNEIESVYVDYDSQGKKDTDYFKYTNYKFDKAGNWIERTETTLDKDKKVTRVGIAGRTITYH
jgi:hypothetical protein